jgi:transposase-like protein
MNIKYSQEFKEQAVQKTLQRGDKSINKIAEELSISVHTLKTWLTHYQPKHMATDKIAKRPTDWTNTERLQALMESYGLKDEPLNAFCRQQGLFAHHLNSWKNEFINAVSSTNKSDGDRTLRNEIQQLNKDLMRKEKALAEAAALLLLQKKFHAYLEEKAY